MPIADTVRGFSPFGTTINHVAFMIGENEPHEGTAKLVVENFWPEFLEVTDRKIGEVFSKEDDSGRVFYALTCRSNENQGKGFSKHVASCLDLMDVPDGERIALIVTGRDMKGSPNQNKLLEIFQGVENSRKKVVIFVDE